MRMMKSKTKLWTLSSGLLGCLCFGGMDMLIVLKLCVKELGKFMEKKPVEHDNEVRSTWIIKKRMQ